jgi:hypothetical protein
MDAPRATKMWVVTVDDKGNEKDGHWVDIPEPNHFASDGFAQIESYVSRLLGSSARFNSVIIATPDQQMAVSLWQHGGVPEFTLSVEWRSEPERERAVRQFFSVRGLSTSHDTSPGMATFQTLLGVWVISCHQTCSLSRHSPRTCCDRFTSCESRTLWISVLRSTMTPSNTYRERCV